MPLVTAKSQITTSLRKQLYNVNYGELCQVPRRITLMTSPSLLGLRDCEIVSESCVTNVVKLWMGRVLKMLAFAKKGGAY